MKKLDEAEAQIDQSLETSKLLTKSVLADAFKEQNQKKFHIPYHDVIATKSFAKNIKNSFAYHFYNYETKSLKPVKPDDVIF